MERTIREFLDIVHEEIKDIVAVSVQDNPSYHTIRKVSVKLRFLLVEGNLQKAWKIVGFQKEPQILVHPLLAGKEDHLKDGVISIGGGARISGIQIMGIHIHNRALSDEEIKANYEREKTIINALPVPIGLRAFLDGTPLKIGNYKPMTRRQIIKYVANKLGGVHFDEKDRDQNVESLRQQIRVLEQEPIYFEVLTYAQQIAESPDLKRLLEKIEELLPGC